MSKKNPIKIKVKKLHRDAKIPTFAKEGDACADLYAIEDTYIPYGHYVAVKSGIAVEIPEGYEIQLRARSGFAAKDGVGSIQNQNRWIL